ncbi:hypothetical protein [Hymenobacter ruricola]|uniref:Uncharacterized protein n=1 Tax=Hymenobacter ruricola TaxID=2791023 RepID=A0ABS0I350_9BACT|nr:hypothetical protein [Hymenobacter ruricola]MBF9221371.1 hypothetical protein [Hymenobacter ruricola]
MESDVTARIRAKASAKRKASRRRAEQRLIDQGRQAGRDLTLYAGRARRWLGLTAAEFRALGDEFARIVGAPGVSSGRAPRAAPAREPAATPRAVAPTLEGEPKIKWSKNAVFPTPDHLLLFGLLQAQSYRKRTQAELVAVCILFGACRSNFRQPHASRWLNRCEPWMRQAAQQCYPEDPAKQAALFKKLAAFTWPLA